MKHLIIMQHFNILKEYENIKLYHGDCMELLKQTPDNYYSLALVDPPYGIGEDGKSNHSRGKCAKPKLYTPKEWDKEPPSIEYFTELFRVSKNQIVWGANHFISRMPYDSSCWIVWDKDNSGNFADCELAWTSFDTAVRKFQWRWNGMLQHNMKDKEQRIHPTQKPVALYDWLLSNYAKEGNLILDTHLGSGSIAIAIDKANRINNMNLQFTGIEIDVDYFNDMIKRFENYKSQLTLTLI